MENPSSEGLTTIMDLPDDCLSFVFQWLDCLSDREAFGLTCRRWLLIQNLNRRSLQFQCSLSYLIPSSLSQHNLTVEYFHLYRLLGRFQHLQSLSLSGCTLLSDEAMTSLQFCGTHLRALYLDCCLSITDGGLSKAAAACPLLEDISIYRCRITDVGLRSLAYFCTGLKHMNLSHCSLISDDGLRALTQACRHIQSISLSTCRYVSGTGFKGISPTLISVEADYCNLRGEGIKEILSGGGIQYLNVSSCGIGGDGLAAMSAGLASNLRILNLRRCVNIGDESIMAIAKCCPLLQEWNLALCHSVRIPGWESIGKNCHNLEKLHVNRCRNLCDRGLEALRNGCKHLTVLYASRCFGFSTTAIELFKCYRGDVVVKYEEVMCMGPKWDLK